MSAPASIRDLHVLQKLLPLPDFQRPFGLLLIRRGSHVCAVCSACTGSPSAGSQARQEDGRPLGPRSEVPGCLRRQPGGEGAGHSCCSSRSSSLCPWSPQVSALLSRATTDRCVPCAGWGRPDKRCAPASGEYACLSLSSCASSDCVCILLALSCVLARRVPGTSRGLISGTSGVREQLHLVPPRNPPEGRLESP